MKQYQNYKDSGSRWINLIPSHWLCYRLRFVCDLRNGYTPSKAEESFWKDGTIPWFRMDDIRENGRFLVKSKQYITQEAVKGNGLFEAGSFILATTATIGEHALLIVDSLANQRFTNLKIRKSLEPGVSRNFLFYYLFIIDEYCKTTTKKTTFPAVNIDDLKNFPVCLPPLAEQKAIAEYLDEKCGKIDGMIEQIDKKIALYERLRRAIIAKTVTKGLDPNVPLRPSGIEWIGEIPMHWDVKRFGYLAWIRARLGWKGLKADEYVESGYPFLSAFNIVNDKMNWESLNYINQFRFEESPEIMLHPGDILLVKDGAGIGKCARVDSLPKGESTTNGSLAVITPFEAVNYKYLHYFIISDSFNQYKDILINGMGVPHLTQGEMKKMYLPVPPIKEQEEIAEYLDKRCHVIEENIANYVKQKELLERYRKALITQVVTGKRRVCEPSFIYPDVTSDSPAMAAE